MLKQFTVVSNEIVEHGAIESIMMQFYYDPEEVKDPEKNLRKAVKDYLKTDAGKQQLNINCGCFNWGDVADIEESFFIPYGIYTFEVKDVDLAVNHNESFVDELEINEEK